MFAITLHFSLFLEQAITVQFQDRKKVLQHQYYIILLSRICTVPGKQDLFELIFKAVHFLVKHYIGEILKTGHIQEF